MHFISFHSTTFTSAIDDPITAKMRNPFSKSTSTISGRTRSSELSPPSSQSSTASPDADEKISVISEATLSPSPARSPAPYYPVLPSPQPSRYTASPPAASPSSEQSAPRCRRCGDPCVRRITRTTNRNGNAGRPFYKCIPCDKFSCFADPVGDSEKNPLCDCGLNSKRDLSSREKGRKIFFTCKSGQCDFFEFHKREDGTDWQVDEDIAKALKDLKFL